MLKSCLQANQQNLSLRTTVQELNKDCGLLVNASRSILYASNGKDFAEPAYKEAKKMQGHEEINRIIFVFRRDVQLLVSTLE